MSDAISKAIEALEGVADMITASDADAYKEVLDVIAALQAEQVRQDMVLVPVVAVEVAIDCLSRHGDAFVCLGAMTELQNAITAAKEQQ